MLTLEERCKMAQECLPDAPYRAMLTALHNDLLETLIDASRYRWLRDNQQRIEIKRRKALMAIATGFTNYEYELFKTLDEAIDSAIKEQGETND